MAVRGTEAWVEQISVRELPALCATVRMLEKLSKDDTASLAQLGQSVLHDQGLTSRLLRVVNSISYNRGRQPVTTVSRAAVILGFNALKHICITAKLLDSMLKSRDISKPVYERLVRLMARSFHAGMLARMMLEEYDEDTREEIYIATLLHHLGEIAFWSMGGPITEQVDECLRAGDEAQAAQIIREQLGTGFDEIGCGLAHSWNMGEVLVRSLSDPQRRTPEMQVIGLADELSASLQAPQAAGAKLPRQLQELGKQMNLALPALKHRLKQCAEETVRLAISYGASSLTPYLDTQAAQGQGVSEYFAPYPEPDESLQLKVLRELTFLAAEKADINLLIHTAMEGIYRGIGLDRVVVLMLTQDKQKLMPRFVSSQNPEQLKARFVVPLFGPPQVFNHVYQTREAIWVEGERDPKWQDKLTVQLRPLLGPGGFFLAPIVLDNHCLGMIYADRADSGRALQREEFFSFTHFVQQTGLCLSVIMR